MIDEPKFCTITEEEIRTMIAAKSASLTDAIGKAEAVLGTGPPPETKPAPEVKAKAATNEVATKSSPLHMRYLTTKVAEAKGKIEGLKFLAAHLGPATHSLTMGQLAHLYEQLAPVDFADWDMTDKKESEAMKDDHPPSPLEGLGLY